MHLLSVMYSFSIEPFARPVSNFNLYIAFVDEPGRVQFTFKKY